MSDKAILAGPALRRLRSREGLTQAAMAERLDISPSYLNLIERNRRPLTARIVLRLVDTFEFDPRVLNQDEAVGGIDGMRRRLADARFADLAIDRDDIAEWLAAAPQGALAFARLYDTAGSAGPGEDEGPVQLARREIERWRNHFADLDARAEELADELRLSNQDIAQGLADRLRQRHQISVRILPGDVMPDHLRRLDLHARQLQLSEMLEPASRNFQLALQIGLLEQRETIRTLAQGTQSPDEAGRKLFERHLQTYFAAAVLMPYDRFVRACEATGYDLPILQRRFNVSYEQLAHRLTTLQRVGRRGLPFFMARLDRAGQFSKRLVAASGTTLLDAPGSCPLWSAHEAFDRAGQLVRQLVTLEGSGGARGTWFTISRTVNGSGARAGDSRFVITLGLDAALAGDLALARGHALRTEAAQPIGLGCTRCHRVDCRQRAVPPSGLALSFSEREKGLTPFRFTAG